MIYQTQLEFIAKVIVSSLGITLSAILVITFALEHIDLQISDPNNATTVFQLLDSIANSSGSSGNVSIPTESYIAKDGQTNPDINLETLMLLATFPTEENIASIVSTQTTEVVGAIEAQAAETIAAIEVAALEIDAAVEEGAVLTVAGIVASIELQTFELVATLGTRDPLSPFSTIADVQYYIEKGNDYLEVIKSGTDRISGTNERLDLLIALLGGSGDIPVIVQMNETLTSINATLNETNERLTQIELNSNITVQQNDAILQAMNSIANKLTTSNEILTNIANSLKLQQNECVPGFTCNYASQSIASKTYYLNSNLAFVDPVLLQNSYNICNNQTC